MRVVLRFWRCASGLEKKRVLYLLSSFLVVLWGGKKGGVLSHFPAIVGLLAFLQELIGVVEEFEEVGGFGGGKPGCSGIVLVGVILACQLAVVHLDLHFRCTEAKAKDL